MKLFFFLITVLIFSESSFNYLYSQQVQSINSDSLRQIELGNLATYSMPDSVLKLFPFQSLNYLNRFYPGVVSYFQDFYIRDGENYETGYFIDGVKFNDLFTGNNSFFLNPSTYKSIDFYNGFITSDIGNTSSGLFNYNLRTGGDKLQFNAEYLTDNITFTNDAFSGNKRLGTYFYGYNETNLNIGGPLLLNNLKFFINTNYLFQRDKNPQRYPGADNLFFNDSVSMDSITINLPAGIVPLNSFESFNLLSTIFYDAEEIKIKVYGIYFNENELSERHHLIDYLNPRTGLINNSGGIINLNLQQDVNNVLSYSINGNYYNKSEVIADPYLGNNYWTYGDSVANAEAGIIWERSVKDINSGRVGRYVLPSFRGVFNYNFTNENYPGVDHKKLNQERVSLAGKLSLNMYGQLIRIGGEYSYHNLMQWELANQNALAYIFVDFRSQPNFDDYSDEELKEFIAFYRGANNFGYSLSGGDLNDDIYKSPEPEFYSIYIDDRINIVNNLSAYLGLRYDHFNFNFKKMVDPTNPDKTVNRSTGEIIENGLIDTDDYSFFSPRIALEFLVINNLSFISTYSEKVQSHPFSDLYQGINSILYILNTGPFNQAYILTGDTKPIETSEFEFGIKFLPLNNLRTGLKYFNKNSKNHLSIDLQEVNPSSAFSSYYYLNADQTFDIWGIEYIIDYYTKGLKFISNICYQNTDVEIIGDRSNKIIINAFMNYDFIHFLKLSGIFRELNLSTQFTFNSGHPYYYTGLRYPDIPYSGTTPNVYQFDLKLEKRIAITEILKLGFYIYVINLFDAKNVYDVFPRTGSADNDGFLDDPEIVRQLVETYGEEYLTLYKLMNQYNPLNQQQTFYGPPRQIGFGIKLNY